MNVIGIECALASSVVSHNCLPDSSKALKRLSVVAPMKMTPLAVTMLPPMLSAPVLSKPFAFSSSTKPRGILQAISPLFTSTATSSPNGGLEHGILVCGSQKRPTGPPHGVVRTQVVGPPCRPLPICIFPTCPMSSTFVNRRPRTGSYEKPFQFAPPSVLGNVTM